MIFSLIAASGGFVYIYLQIRLFDLTGLKSSRVAQEFNVFVHSGVAVLGTLRGILFFLLCERGGI